jgi:predicted aconitase
LTLEEQAMLDGEKGAAATWGLQFQIAVGEYFGATRLLPIRSAHVMCDSEAVNEAGIAFMERWAEEGSEVAVPTSLDPRSADFAHAARLGQDEEVLVREKRILKAMTALGAIPSNTCINYQILDVPRYGEHLGWGDTGAVIYANSVAGARSNFEGGPAALAAALTGRVADYGFHRDDHRRGTAAVRLETTPRHAADWGALGCLVGRRLPSYGEVPVFSGPDLEPSVDELKQLGASLASYGSQGMFHMIGVTPEAEDEQEAFGGRKPHTMIRVTREDLDAVYAAFRADADPDVVVFGTPQLSLLEFKELSEQLRGRKVRLPMLLTTAPQVKCAAETFGYLDELDAGVTVLSGVCFYVMTAREVGARNNFRVIATDSAKLANIIEGYGFQPVFRPREQCLEIAMTGKVRA